MNLRRQVLTDPARRRDLAMIHVAKKQLAMDDDAYRAMLWTVGRARSAGDLDHAGRAAVIDHLKACGFKPRPAGKRRGTNEWAWVDAAPEGKRRMLRKIIMLIGGRGKDYADAIAKKMFNVERIEFVAEEQLRSVIAALNYDARRHAQADER